MIVYFAIIILLILFSICRKNIGIEYFTHITLIVFLCFGYMTGSDWRAYESEYYSEFANRIVEPGYMFLSNLSHSLGIDFWTFHVLIKVVCYLIIMRYISINTTQANPSFAIMLYVASFGFFLFINCPFRNLISISIATISFPYLCQRKYTTYYIIIVIASLFHFSALFLLLLPILKFNNLSNITLIIIYVTLLLLFAVGFDKIMINTILANIPFLQTRLDEYRDNAELYSGNIFSVGLIIRILCLSGMLFFRHLISNIYDNKGNIFNLCYIYLLLSLLSYATPILFRLPLFLAPCYVVMMHYITNCFSISNKLIVKLLFGLISIAITNKTISSVYYVPYTNYIYYMITSQYPSYEYRCNYNFKNSPFIK